MFDNEPFFKLMKKDILAFGIDGAVLLAFIAEFEARNHKCWVSRRYIAERLGVSEATVQRLIKKLIAEGALTCSTTDGRRVLETVSDRWSRFGFVETMTLSSLTLDKRDVSN